MRRPSRSDEGVRRREFLIGGAAALAWVRCTTGPDAVTGPDGGGGGGGGAPDGSGSAEADGAPGADCAETEANIEGPFYKEGAPSRMVLVDADTPGTRITVSGRVLAADGCTPLAGATLDVWQADASGAYDNDGFRLRGVLETAGDGSYEIVTIVPGHYLNGDRYRPAHIHVKASAPGHQLLTTQLYFADDPYNEGDPYIRDSLIMAPSENADGSLAATFDFVLG
jgi:protocatechuate 3,4-dioxygenase beta subunit